MSKFKNLFLILTLLFSSDAFAGTKWNVDANGNATGNSITVSGISQSATSKITSLGTAGIVHNDSSGNLSTSKIFNNDVDSAAAIDFLKINSDKLGNGYTTFVATGTTINLTNPLYNRIITTGGGTGIIKFPKMDDVNSISSGKNTFSLITNNCGGPIFMQDFGGSSISTINPGQSKLFFITSNGSSSGGFNILDVTGIISAAPPLTYNSGFLSISQSSASTDGSISSIDWNTFNNKQSAISIGNVDTGSQNAAGMNLIGSQLSLTSASALFPGVLTTGVQTISGNKTFNGNISAANLLGTNTGNVTLNPVGVSSNANGAQLIGQQLELEPASASFPGLITAGTQAIGGDKNFAGNITASNLSGTNTGDITITSVGSTPNANGMTLTGQALNLQPADGTHPGIITTLLQTFSGVKQFNASIRLLSLATSRALVIDGSNNITTSSITDSALATLNQPANQVIVGNGASGLTSFSNFTFASNVLSVPQQITITNNLSGPFLQLGDGLTSQGPIFALANTSGGFYFSNAISGDAILRNSDNTKNFRIGVGAVNSQLSISNSNITVNTGVNVGIGTATPNASSILHLVSTTQGLEPPSMSTTQMNSISSPISGLEIYDNTILQPRYYNGTVWSEGMGTAPVITTSQTITHDYTNWLVNNAASTPVTITLPLLSSCIQGEKFRIIKESTNSSNTVTIATSGSDVFHPAPSNLNAQYSFGVFVNMGSFWLYAGNGG